MQLLHGNRFALFFTLLFTSELASEIKGLYSQNPLPSEVSCFLFPPLVRTTLSHPLFIALITVQIFNPLHGCQGSALVLRISLGGYLLLLALSSAS